MCVWVWVLTGTRRLSGGVGLWEGIHIALRHSQVCPSAHTLKEAIFNIVKFAVKYNVAMAVISVCRCFVCLSVYMSLSPTHTHTHTHTHVMTDTTLDVRILFLPPDLDLL